MGNTQACCATPTGPPKAEHRVLMVGLDGAGKTTTLQSIARSQPACEEPQLNTLPTLSYSVEELRWRRERLLVWDVGGQDKLRALWRHFYGEVSCLVFVLDSGDKARLTEARDELRSLLAAPELASTPLLVLANKQDLGYACPTTEIEEILQLSALDSGSDARPWKLQPTSAWTGTGLSSAMDWVTEQVAGTTLSTQKDGERLASLDANNTLACNTEVSLRQRRDGERRRRQHRRGSSQ